MQIKQEKNIITKGRDPIELHLIEITNINQARNVSHWPKNWIE